MQAAEDSICPAAQAGDLVVTELRVTQKVSQPPSAPISYGGFVELYNAGGSALELRGLVLVFRSINGGTYTRAIVRDDLSVAPGAYIALSPSDAAGAADQPLQPTFGYDLKGTLPGNAELTVSACDRVIDTMVYRTLPTSGAWALTQLTDSPPTATFNDVEDAWCTQYGTESQPLGSPGAANNSCLEPLK